MLEQAPRLPAQVQVPLSPQVPLQQSPSWLQVALSAAQAHLPPLQLRPSQQSALVAQSPDTGEQAQAWSWQLPLQQPLFCPQLLPKSLHPQVPFTQLPPQQSPLLWHAPPATLHWQLSSHVSSAATSARSNSARWRFPA